MKDKQLDFGDFAKNSFINSTAYQEFAKNGFAKKGGITLNEENINTVFLYLQKWIEEKYDSGNIVSSNLTQDMEEFRNSISNMFKTDNDDSIGNLKEEIIQLKKEVAQLYNVVFVLVKSDSCVLE